MDTLQTDLAAARAPVFTPATAAAPTSRDTVLWCRDGRELAAVWHEPAHPARAVAIVSGATGVAQRYYRAFAQWLASRGYAVLTYDYRGLGESRRGDVRRETASMRDWAQLDMSAAFAAAGLRRDGASGAALPLLHVGHSFGGNAVGLAEGHERADALLGIASQSGDWRNWPGVHRLVTATFFHTLPLIVGAFGCAPAWVMGGRGEPLPRHVALEWARWGRRRGFLYTDESLGDARRFDRFTGAVHLWNVSDDLTYGPRGAVDALAAQFTRAQVQRHTLQPQEAGVARLGHFGAFRRDIGPAVWRRWLAPLEAATPALARARLAD